MNFKFSDKIRRVKEANKSDIRLMSIENEKVKGINLAQGICDLDLPEVLKKRAQNAIEEKNNSYTRCDGIYEIREAVAKKIKKYNNIDADPDKNIVVTSGATGAFYCACITMLNPGDEVILFEPYYGLHVSTVLAVGALPVFAKLNPPEWSFDINEIAELISPKTKAIIINNPANPCGKVFKRDELEQIADFAIEHDLIILTDEIYEYIVFDGNKHVSLASIERVKDRVITVSGYSKTFSVTGWRIGYCVCNETIAEMIACAHDLIYICAPAPFKVGVFKSINTLNDEYYHNICNEYRKKRNKLCAVLEEIGLTPYIPNGAYYTLVNAEKLKGINSKEKAMYLLNKIGIAAVPGRAFYNGDRGDNYLRFCFGRDDSILDEACKRLLTLDLY